MAIVTGAASGIGKATALMLNARGVKVIAEDYADSVFDLQNEEKNILALKADVTLEESAEKAISFAVEKFGKLDILVNNAGRIINKLVVDTTLDDWNLIMATNVTGAFLHTKEALKVMIPNNSGAIVNIGSYACFFTFPTISAYTASKGALAQLTRTTAIENIQYGIRVNAIGVGDVVTNLLNEERSDGREFLTKHGQIAPIKRAADPDEIAEIVSFVASDRASFMVGSIIMADGGMSVTIQ